MTRGTSPSGGSKGEETPIVSGWPNLHRKKLVEGVWKTKVNHAFTNSMGGKTWLGASLSEPWLREEKWWVWLKVSMAQVPQNVGAPVGGTAFLTQHYEGLLMI